MSNKEICYKLLESFSESQLANIATMLKAASDAINEAADVSFCTSLYNEYLSDPERGESVSIEEAAAILGVQL